MENQQRRNDNKALTTGTSCTTVLLLLLAGVMPHQSSITTFAFSVQRMNMRTVAAPAPARRSCSRLHLSREEYLTPHFETSTTATMRSYDFDFERIVECAQVGECPVDEMTQMLEELTRLDEKEGGGGGVLSSSAGMAALEVAESEEARNAVLHALHSQVELAKARTELKEAGLVEQQRQNQHQQQPELQPPSEQRDIHDLMRLMRDIAEHEEV
mmetsp:Transcript_108783/g.302430  ORF Transcript_108783/g.302430 Transcript_108783/m.302430 type:complete len:214 (-) Transcript_108783:240-881(-)